MVQLLTADVWFVTPPLPFEWQGHRIAAITQYDKTSLSFFGLPRTLPS
jgi:hypothetical protein